MEFQPGDRVHYFAHGTRTVLKGLHDGLCGSGYVVSDPNARSGGRWVHEHEVSALTESSRSEGESMEIRIRVTPEKLAEVITSSWEDSHDMRSEPTKVEDDLLPVLTEILDDLAYPESVELIARHVARWTTEERA